MARTSGRKYSRDSRGRFASSGAKPSASFTRGDAQRATRSNQPARAAARARDNSNRASANMKMARMVSTTAPKSAKALHAFNAKQGKKASRSKRTAERARQYYKAQGL